MSQGGTVSGSAQNTLIFDNSNGDLLLHRYLSYTGVSRTCELGDYDDWATDSLLFAGVSFIRSPYQSYAELLSSPYAAEDWTIPYNDQPAGFSTLVTVENLTVTLGLPAESVTSGQGVMLADVADHVTGDNETHDGMFSPNDAGSTAAESYATVGIARTNATVDGTAANHADHTVDKDDLIQDYHAAIEILLWR
jgi:hypothetical protein